jgi:tRNA A37 threonylcarbamoyladenosine biosynthesis protein TsaE
MCFVEWPEKVTDIFPDNTVFSTFEIISDIERKLIIQLPS